MGRRPTATGVSPRAVSTAASVLPGVPLPTWSTAAGTGPTRFLPPPLEDAEPAAPPPPQRPRARLARTDIAQPPAEPAPPTHEDELVRARVLVADRTAGVTPPSEPPAGRIPFPVPARDPKPERTGAGRVRGEHRAPAATPASGHGAGAMLVVAVLVVAVVGLAFATLVVPSLVDPVDRSGDTTPQVRPQTVALAAPSGYRVATGAAARAMAADARTQVGGLGTAAPTAAAYVKAGSPTQVVAAGIPARTDATGKQAYLTGWHRAVHARSVSSVAQLPAGTVGTCGTMKRNGVTGAGCAFAGDDVAGMLWMPKANPAAAARALPAVVRSVHVG